MNERPFEIADVGKTDLLNKISRGRLGTVHLPVYRPLMLDLLAGEADPIRLPERVEEWQSIHHSEMGWIWIHYL